LPCYALSLKRNTYYIGGQKIEKNNIDYDGKIYNVSTETGMVILKHNDRIIIGASNNI
jgi:hypothetical protein